MNSNGELPAGLVDIHCHFLPGIDDGCKNIAESIQCINMLKDVGYVASICTPHVALIHYPNNRVPLIHQATEQLQKDLDAKSVDYKVWAGGEIRLPSKSGTLLAIDEIPRLGSSNYCLFDWWGRKWSDQFDEYFAELIENGLQPILAHPERLPLDEKAFESLIRKLLNQGVLLQGNLKSFADESDQRVRTRSRKLLKDNHYYIIASDSHGPGSIPSRIVGLKQLRELIDEDQLTELMSTRPRRML